MTGDLIQELLAERFGDRPPWRERWAKPLPVRIVEDELTLARRRRALNEAMDDSANPVPRGRRAAA